MFFKVGAYRGCPACHCCRSTAALVSVAIESMIHAMVNCACSLDTIHCDVFLSLLDTITIVSSIWYYWKWIHLFWKSSSFAEAIDTHMKRYSMAELSKDPDNKSASLLIPSIYSMHLTEMEKARYVTAQTWRNMSICFKSKHMHKT